MRTLYGEHSVLVHSQASLIAVILSRTFSGVYLRRRARHEMVAAIWSTIYQYEALGAITWPDWEASTAFIAISCLRVLSINDQYRLVSATVSSWFSLPLHRLPGNRSPVGGADLTIPDKLTAEGQPSFLSATMLWNRGPTCSLRFSCRARY